MDEVKMWTIEGAEASPVPSGGMDVVNALIYLFRPTAEASPVPSGGMDRERHLEEILVKNPELLMPGLTLVGRQTQTESGPLDLLGVDSDGRLVVFELKRGPASRDAIAQIIDYASDLEAMDLDTLVKHISDRSGAHGIGEVGDSEEWYAENLGMEDLESLKSLRMFLVGLGADDRTERMVNFLANRGVDISLLTFYGFTHADKTLLVRIVHQEGIDDENSEPVRRRRPSQQEYQDSLDSRVEKYGVSEPVQRCTKMFQENWRNPRERNNQYGVNFYLPSQSKTGRRTSIRSARLSAHGHGLEVTFFFLPLGCV